MFNRLQGEDYNLCDMTELYLNLAAYEHASDHLYTPSLGRLMHPDELPVIMRCTVDPVCPESHLCGGVALRLAVDVTQQSCAPPQPGVHHAPDGRLLARYAVVVIVIREALVFPPYWLFCPGRPTDRCKMGKKILELMSDEKDFWVWERFSPIT